MNHRTIVIGILLVLASSMSARTLSWDWWPTQICDTTLGQDSLHYQTQISAVVSSGQYAPFWLQSLQQGNIAPSAMSGNIHVGLLKPMQSAKRWFDYEFGFELIGRLQSAMPEYSPYPSSLGTGYFHQLYAHARLYVFDITAGIRPMVYLTADSTLSMGSLLLSGNAHNMPRLSIGIEKFTPVPGCYGYLEIKGGLTQAWAMDNVYIQHWMLHHKYIGLRVGGRLPVNLSYEVHHAAQWGGFSPRYGDLGNDGQSYINAFFARAGGSMLNDQLNAQGNHLVSQQLTLTGKGKQWQVDVYWQNIAEDNLSFIGFGQNVADGLWGISIRLKNQKWVEGVCYEFLNTTDQSGPWHDRDGLCYAGSDNYYQNGVYTNGWNYWYRTLGTPYITSPLYNTACDNIVTTNSRVRVHHLGIRGNIYGFRYLIQASYARNYGNIQTENCPINTNTALLLSVEKHVPQAWGLDFGIKIASDLGSQFGNQVGAQFIIRKQGLIASWTKENIQ